jgi:hypothetical protein
MNASLMSDIEENSRQVSMQRRMSTLEDG